MMKFSFAICFCFLFTIVGSGCDPRDKWQGGGQAAVEEPPTGGNGGQNFICLSNDDCAADELCNSRGQCVFPGPAGKDGTDGKDGEDGKGNKPCTTDADCAGDDVCSPSSNTCTTPGPAGKDGEDGKDGVDGQDGTDGADGKDGESCSIVDNGDGTATITCGNGTFTVKNGQDGTDGQDGKDGQDSVCGITDNGDCTYTITLCAGGLEIVVNDASCSNPPECTSDAECADEDETTLDWCDNTGKCHNSPPFNCDDGDACTTDEFVAGACIHTPVACADGEVCDETNGECVPEEPTCHTLEVTAEWIFQGVVGPIGSDTWPTGEWKSCPNDTTGSDEPCQTLTWCGDEAVLFNVQAIPGANPAWAINGEWSETDSDWCGFVTPQEKELGIGLEKYASEAMFVGDTPSDIGCEVVCGPDGYLDWLCLPTE